MSVITLFVEFLAAHPNSTYFILFLGSYFECIILINFIIRGEVFFIAGAILAGMGYLNIWYVAIVCILGGLLGDNSSYFIGRRYGVLFVEKFFKSTNKYLTLKRYNIGKVFLNNLGLRSIFFARFMGPLAWITPFVAGTMKVRYRDFVKYNAPGAVIGIGTFLLVGYLFGYSSSLILPDVFRGLFAAAFIAIAIMVYFAFIKRRVTKHHV